MKKNSSIIIFLYKRIFPFRILFSLFALSLILFLMAAFIFFIDNVYTSPVGWERQSIISPKGAVARNFSVAKRGNLLVCVFESSKSGNSKIYSSISFDGGIKFTKSREICKFRSDISNNPKIAIDKKGKLYLCWYTISADGSEGRMFLKRSDDYGTTWTKERIISFNLKMEILPSLYCDAKNRIHLFFAASQGGGFTLFHSIMGKGGNFGEPNKISKLRGGLKGAFFPAVKFYKNKAIVIWQSKERNFKDNLYFIKSHDYGDSWSGVDKITTGLFNNQAPDFVIAKDTIFLAYMNNRKKSWGIELLKGFNYGDRWSSPRQVSLTNVNCYSPSIVVSQGNEILVTWHDSREKGNRIFYRKLPMMGGLTKSVEKKLSFKKRAGKHPVTVKSGENVLVFWEEAGRVVVNRADISVLSPVVVSPTHPQRSWSRSKDATVTWTKPQDESGISGYAILVDDKPDTQPVIQNYRYDQTTSNLKGLKDGITYFHIRAIDGAGNMSRTVHYKIKVSSTPLPMPVIVSSTHPEGGGSLRKKADFRWAVYFPVVTC